MYAPIKGGSVEVIQGLKCNIPPVGYLYDYSADKWVKKGVYEKNPRVPQYCFWQIDPRWSEYKRWEEEEAKFRKNDDDYIHGQLQRFKEDMWFHRMSGLWFSNNGVPTYITGEHWYYLSVYNLDDGIPMYKDIDRRYFYAVKYAHDDPNSMGNIEMTCRRSGKSFRAGSIALQRASQNAQFNVGIQSKNEKDAETFYLTKIIEPFRAMPSFFRPVTNLPKDKGMPKSGLFFETGKMATDSDELKSKIFFKAQGEKAFDSQKLGFYVGDEEGKTEGADVEERWNTVRYCLINKSRGTIIGKSIHTTTVEKKGGQAFWNLWKNSNPLDYEDGITPTRLYKFFIPADEAGPPDDYGFPKDRAAEKARIMLDRERNKDNPSVLVSMIQKEPLNEQEAFQLGDSSGLFNPLILNEALNRIKWHIGEPLFETGNFQWVNGEKDTDVEWVPSPTGRFKMFYHLPENERNKYTLSGRRMKPANTIKYKAGADPYQYDNVTKSSKKKASDGAFAIYKTDLKEDECDMDGGFVLTYKGRPALLDIYSEDCIMACVYYGCKILMETNKDRMERYWVNRNYDLYFHWRPDKEKPGVYASKETTQDLCSLHEQLINNYSHTIKSEEYILEALRFNPGETQEFDLMMASGYALLMEFDERPRKKAKEQTNDLSFSRLFGRK